MSSAVFSESWYRIADARVALLPTVSVDRHQFRGKNWYVLQDTYSHKFFRVTPETYAFIAALTPERTVEEVWLSFVEQKPEQAPSQDEIVRVLSQLHVANLLYYQGQGDSQAIFRRSHTQKQRELRGKLMSFLYVRIFLFDPDKWLDRSRKLIDALVNPVALAVWAVVVLSGLVVAVENSGALFDRSQGLFSLSNLPWLFISLTTMKLLHETGHAFVCKRFDGRVHAFGVMFLILTPLPYVDMTSSWSFKNRFNRALVGAAGMMVELFLAAIAAMIWARTSPGLVNSLAFNVMVVGSVSSLVFNGNPLLRFDAYYILTDLVDIPNLYQKAQQQWLYFMDRYLLGTPTAESPATDKREWWWFTAYGILAFCYRMTVTVGIVLFVLDQWFVIGLIMATITAATMIFMPAQKLLTHLKSAKVQPNRQRAIATVAGICATVVLVGGVIPFPYSIRAFGVLQAHQSSTMHAVTDGSLVTLVAPDGAAVDKGSVLAVLSNPDLEYEVELTRQQQRETELLLRLSIYKGIADIAPIEKRLQALHAQMANLERQKQLLVVRAPHAGEWVAPMLHERNGAWMAKGQVLGELVQGSRFRFVAVVPQEQADELFKHQLHGGKLRLTGQTGVTIDIKEFTLIPYQRERLQSSALGWMGGGEIAVKPGDQSGQSTTESFYELRALLPDDAPADLQPLHGLSGVLRVPLPNQPLFWQARKALMQLFQKRYGI